MKIFPKCSPSHGSILNNTKQEKPIPFLLTNIADGLDPAIRQLDGVAALGHSRVGPLLGPVVVHAAVLVIHSEIVGVRLGLEIKLVIDCGKHYY